eukprot:symbB.v1.2.008557.t3/scaffold511.1/size325556/4
MDDAKPENGKPEDAQVACRICLAREGELLAPCPCRGSLRFAHLECLKKEFLARREWTQLTCSICKNEYVAPAVLDLARLALEWAEADWGSKTVGTLVAADHLGRVLSAAGQLEEAEQHLRRALDGLKEVVGIEHAETHIARSNLGMLLNSRGRFQEAEEHVRGAWEGSRSLSGPKNAETLVFGMNLAVVLRELNRPREAEPLLREALEGLDELKGKQHPDALAAASHLSGLLLHLREDLGEAEPLARRAWEGSLRHFGPDHPRSLCATADLGLLLLARERPKEGEQLLRCALEGFQKQLGESHPQALSTAADLGTALFAAGRKEESLIPLRAALEGRQKLLGTDHLRSLASAHNLGVALADLHEVEEAKKLLQAAWQGRAHKLGPDHFRTLASAKRLLPLLQEADEEALAAQALRSVWEGETANLGASHPNAVQAARKLAQWLARRQLLFEAEAVLAHALASAQAEETQRAIEEAESTSAGASEDERPCDERATRLLQSALLGSSFNPANCLAKLAAAQQRPSPSKVLSADLQDLQDRLARLEEAEAEAEEDGEEAMPPRKKHRGERMSRDEDQQDGVDCASERRLNPAAASLAFVESLNRAVDPRTHEPEGCGTIMDICQPPPTFNTTTACVCSGNWDFAPVGTTSVQPPAATTAVEAVLPNTEGTTTEPTNPFAAPTATVVTLQPQVPAAEETAAADTDSTTAASASSESAEAQPAAGNAAPTGRRLREDVGPWMGSLGAFCGKWGNDDFVTGEWCFVLPSQQCSPNARSQYVSTRGYPMIRSTAPCSGEVDSRSALLLLGHEEMMNPLKFVALLGAALWLFAGTGYMLYLYPSHETKYEALRSQPRRQQRESPIHGFGGFGGPQVEMYSPELVEQQNTSYNMRRFQEAQAKAVNKLSRNTPEDLRLQIYAYYKQATEGDAQGDRPTYFKQKERAKYDAWVKCRGMSFDDAVDKYCQVVDRI